MATGYEQVRSVAAYLAGDLKAADDVQLVLPETGVCTTNFGVRSETENSGCCGGPATAAADACCADDEKAKAEGTTGCGCTTSSKSEPEKAMAKRSACCG
jgi:hypothetical protein